MSTLSEFLAAQNPGAPPAPGSISNEMLVNTAVADLSGVNTGDQDLSGLQPAGDYATNSDVSTAVSNHSSADDPHGDRAYADSLVIGLVDDRGSFNASVNTFPTTGGSGGAGSIRKGDLWTISMVATSGPLSGYPAGCLIRALTDSPGQTVGNWSILEVGFGYTPENAANKSTSIVSDQASDIKYPSAKAVFTWGQSAISFGTGVQTALGVNIGSPDAPVLFNGAAGTPSSIVLTNASGTAASLTAGAASILATARTINGVSFNGSSNITVSAAASTLTGNTLASGVTLSSLTQVGVVSSGTWQGTAVADAYIASSATWNAKQAALVSGTSIKTVNGTSLLGSGNITTGGAWGSITGTFTSQAEFAPGNVTMGGFTTPNPPSAIRSANLNGVYAYHRDNEKSWRIQSRLSRKVVGRCGSIRGLDLGDSTMVSSHQMLMRKFGYGGVDINAANGGAGGSVTLDYTLSPAGNVRVLTSGQSFVITSTAQFATIGVGYITSASGGTLKIELQIDKTGSYADNTNAWYLGRQAYGTVTSGSKLLYVEDYSILRDGLTISGTGVAANTTITCSTGPIRLTADIAAGTGYANATYSNVPLTGGTGSSATANITVSGGSVASVTIVNVGTGYTEGDVLSATTANLGGSGSGFTVAVGGVWPTLSQNATSTATSVLNLNWPNAGSDSGGGVLNTYAASGGGCSMAFLRNGTSTDEFPKSYNVKVTCLSGTVTLTDIVLSAGAYHNTGTHFPWSGMSHSWGVSGTRMGLHHNVTSGAVWNRIAWYIDPEIITYKTANDVGSYDVATIWPQYAGKIRAACPNATIVVYGTHPIAGGTLNSLADRNDVTMAQWDDYMRRWCAENDGAIFIDLRANWPTITRQQYKVDSFTANETDATHINQYGQDWATALLHDAIGPALDYVSSGVFNYQEPGYSHSKPASGWFNEIRVVDDRGNDHAVYGGSANNTVGLKIFVPNKGEAFLTLNSFGVDKNVNFSGISIGNAYNSNNTDCCLSLWNKGSRVESWSASRGAYFACQGGIPADSAKASGGFRFHGPANWSGLPTFTVEADSSYNSTPTHPIFQIARNATTSANGTNLWQYLLNGNVIYDGPTADSNKITFVYADPTSNVTITTPAQTGTVAVILTGTGSLDFPSIAGGAEATLTLTVTGAVTTNTPSVSLGWSAALPDGIVVKQAWVSAADTVSVRVANITASPIDPSAVTCRATVNNF